MNINDLIQQGENSAVEFKTADVRPESLAKEMVAFANGQGDANPVVGAGLNDLSASVIDKYLERYDLSLADEPDHERLLGNMDVMRVGVPTIAGLLIFGINPQRFLPNACISYAHFKGENIESELVDKQVIEGTLPEQIEKTFAVLKNNRLAPSDIHGVKAEPLVQGYPDKVLRELIVNCVVHRNYSIAGSRVRIFQFDNRIEFISPGRLPNTVSVEKLAYGVSYASNPIILKFLENLRYVDKLGRGLPMVYQAAKKLGRQVFFEEVGEEFKVTLPLKG